MNVCHFELHPHSSTKMLMNDPALMIYLYNILNPWFQSPKEENSSTLLIQMLCQTHEWVQKW